MKKSDFVLDYALLEALKTGAMATEDRAMIIRLRAGLKGVAAEIGAAAAELKDAADGEARLAALLDDEMAVDDMRISDEAWTAAVGSMREDKVVIRPGGEAMEIGMEEYLEMVWERMVGKG